jgi:hypothetical protein
VDDKKEGFGNYTMADGRIYEGWWLDGKQHGIGTFYFTNSKLSHSCISNIYRKNGR